MIIRTLKIKDIIFNNPVITASGTSGMGKELEDFIDYSKLGGITLKTVTYTPRKGNPPPRILEVNAGLLNSIGLENDGFHKVYNELKNNNYLKKYNTKIIFSIAGDSVDNFIEMTEAFSSIDEIDILELNLSCPNVHEGGKTFDSNPENIKNILNNIKKINNVKPITVKLSPQNDLVTNSKIVEDYGGDCLTISNTFLGTAIDINKKDFIFKNKVAGYSGPAIKPIALYNVYRVSQQVKIPIIASGGISNTNDALEFIIAGATFVSIGTMNFVEPDISEIIANDLKKYINNYNLILN